MMRSQLNIFLLGVSLSQPSKCGRQHTLNIVHAQTAAQQKSNGSSEARMSGKCGEWRDYFIMTLSPIHWVPVQMLARRSSLGQRMQKEEQCAATLPFRHCCNQSGWLIPRIYSTHRGQAVLYLGCKWQRAVLYVLQLFVKSE